MSGPGAWPCTYCVRDLVMHPPTIAPIVVTNSRRETPLGYDIRSLAAGLTLEQFDEVFGSGWHVEIGNVGWRLGGWGNYLVAGTPLCYGHAWSELKPTPVDQVALAARSGRWRP